MLLMQARPEVGRKEERCVSFPKRKERRLGRQRDGGNSSPAADSSAE
jgi:hypothetical protein